jgi:hypothetical protein
LPREKGVIAWEIQLRQGRDARAWHRAFGLLGKATNGTPGAQQQDAPWNKNSPTRFEARPKQPTIITNFGLLISGVLKNRSRALSEMEKHSAARREISQSKIDRYNDILPNGHTEEKDTVNEGGEDLCAVPAIGVVRIGRTLGGELDGVECND